MDNFKKQIVEDIEYIKRNYSSSNPLLNKNEYAFNYWILSKLFNIDEEVIEDYITEYVDDGVDCYTFFEDSKELYIIQNKYYSEDTNVDIRYIENDFLSRPLTSLKNGNYRRSIELQDIFNKFKNDSEFTIHLNMYVSNNNKSDNIVKAFEKFRNTDTEVGCYIDAKIYFLDEIRNQFFEDRHEPSKNFKCSFYTINDGTVLNISTENYNLPNLIDAKYILTPVSQIYEILKDAKAKDYPLFEENIRDYLGNKGINSKIAKTLEDENERANFFYYNNGITVICDSVKKETSTGGGYQRRYVTYNPQIVNGCQTVNTIYEVLKKYNEEDIVNEFKDTFVMVKLLVLNQEHEYLYKNIVKYNNSQNAINEKSFEANKSIFRNIQREFENRGFLLSVKQSDTNTFKTTRRFNDYREKLLENSELFNLKFEKIEDIIIPLEKLLQVLLSFDQGGYKAFTKKSYVLKTGSNENKSLIEFIKNGMYTFDDILRIYLLFLKAEKEKKESDDNRTPIPYYLISFLGEKFKYKNKDAIRDAIQYMFSSNKTLNDIYGYYKNVTKQYKIQYKRQKDIEYNQMIKSAIDNELLNHSFEDAMEMLDNFDTKQTIKNLNNILK